MGRKNRSKKKEDPGNAADFTVNPFSDLNLPELPPEPVQENSDTAGQDTNETLNFSEQRSRHPASAHGTTMKLHFRKERKKRGGKIVTVVTGIEHLDLLDQMELVRSLKKDLGIGGTVENNTLVLQGDVCERAADWFSRHGRL